MSVKRREKAYREGTDGRQRKILDGRAKLIDRCGDGRSSVVQRFDFDVNLSLDFVFTFAVRTRVEIACNVRKSLKNSSKKASN